MPFTNFEIIKQPFDYPTSSNLYILFIILIVSFFSFRKRKDTPNFMDVTQTNQLKGMAMLLVVVGHLWVHVSQFLAVPTLGDYSVTVFFILSGFGLTTSAKKKGVEKFFLLRLSRIFITYWATTFLWLLFDWYFLSKTYSIFNIFLTLLGINLDPILQKIDYVRWFITLLLIWYILFYLSFKYLHGIRFVLTMLLLGIGISILKRLGIFPIGAYHQLIAFPFGCVFAYYIKEIRSFLTLKKHSLFLLISSIILLLIEAALLYLQFPNYKPVFKIAKIFLMNLSPYIFFAMLILFLSIFRNYESMFLSFCGTISYELFLLHGPILIKYNPIFPYFNSNYIILGFTIYLFLTVNLSYILHKCMKELNYAINKHF
jgi:peptidoglycan/LPS O-acetylase OafA/YrhL